MIMKRLYIFLLIATSLVQSGFSQANSEQESFKKLILTQYDDYFEKVEFTTGGLTSLSAKEDYYSLSLEKKMAVMEFVLSKWKEKLVVVTCQYKRELWEKNASSETVLLDSWDMNTLAIQQKDERTLQTSNVHPWFFFFGGQTNFSSDNFALMFSSSIGSFLYKDRWNIALSGSLGINDNGGNTLTNASIGLHSKVYFPVKKYHISPYIGAGISRVITITQDGTGDNSYWDKMLLFGISWYVGPGSLDIGFQYGKNFTTMIGYTFSLSRSK